MQATTNVNVKNSLSKKKRKHSRGSKAHIDAIKLPDELVDLIKEDDNQSSYLGGGIAVVVIILLLGLIAIATYLSMQKSDKKNFQTPLHFTDIFHLSSMNSQIEFKWIKDILIFRNSSGNLYSLITSGATNLNSLLLLPNQYYQKGMSISNDLSAWFYPVKILQSQHLRNTFTYELMYLSNNLPFYRRIQIKSGFDNYLTSVAWGPKNKIMIAVYMGNIYYSANPFMEDSFACLTCNLSPTRLYGEFIDYYADEIFNTNMAYWWNKDGNILAFLSITDEINKLVTVEVFEFKSLYSEFSNISYSKAGSFPIPYNCELYAIELESRKIFTFDIQKFAPFKPYYVVNVQWFNSSDIIISLLSQRQNKGAILFCKLMENNCFVVLEQVFSSGWIDWREYQNIITLENQYSLAMAITTSDVYDARRQLAIITINKQSKNIIKWLTKGNNCIVELNGFDAITKNIFYLSVNYNSTTRHLYRTNIETLVTECVSCQGFSCDRNKVYFSSNTSLFLQECQGIQPSTYQIVYLQQTNNSIMFQSVKLEWKKNVYQFLINKTMPRVEYFPIQITENYRNYFILSKIYYPKQLNPEHVIKYPVLIILPDDPFNNNIRDDSSVGWIEYLTSFLQFVVIELEVRGAKDHFYNYQTTLTNSLGIKDLKDILSGLKSIFNQRKYLDNSSIGVVGHKYGGYLAVKLLYEHDDFPNFRCGVSINPIFDFSLYNSFFAERYFQIDQKDINYNYKNSKVKFTSNIPSKEYILIHDVNQSDVLFDNSMKLLKELIEHDVQFDYLPLYGYTQETAPWNQNKYMLKKVTNFLTNCFNKSSLHYFLLANSDFYSY